MNITISDIESYLPERVISNNELTEKFGFDKDFLDNKIGILERRISAENETTSDLAYNAAKKLFDSGKYQTQDIDLVLLCTQNPDYKLPTTACLVQTRLGIPTTSLAFDLNLGCSGFIYSLVVASSMIETGVVTKALVIMADQYSKIIDYTDKNTASLFGDGAAACILEKGTKEGYGILGYDFGSDGKGAQNLIANNSGGFKDAEKNDFLYMNGREILKFSMLVVPKSIENVLKKQNLQISDISHFIFHQANAYMLKEIQKRLEIPDEKMVIEMKMTGNTVSATIPLALKKLREDNKIKSGDLLVFCGFGVGLSWGSIIYKVY